MIYLHTQKGIERSYWLAKIEACFGVSAAGRNLNVIFKLRKMIKKA
ncbi:MAG: hypothetical protein ACI845_002734 [Gammaproteobacteria bacterium]|jgi:hypothetical protein